jgi:hypothetical protein
MKGSDAMIPMKVSALTVDPFTGLPVVILKDEVGGTCLPLGVGLTEASAIAAELDDIQLERPMTHQLMSALLARANVCVRRIEIRDCCDNRYFACVCLQLPTGQEIAEEARPSDAIALALHVGAEIAVAAHVLDRGARLDPAELSFDDFDELDESELELELERRELTVGTAAPQGGVATRNARPGQRQSAQTQSSQGAGQASSHAAGRTPAPQAIPGCAHARVSGDPASARRRALHGDDPFDSGLLLPGHASSPSGEAEILARLGDEAFGKWKM